MIYLYISIIYLLNNRSIYILDVFIIIDFNIDGIKIQDDQI